MAATTGYSSVPLLKKLGVRDGMSALLIAVPETVEELAGFADWACVKRVKTLRGSLAGPYDYVHMFADKARAVETGMPKLKNALKPAGMIWVS